MFLRLLFLTLLSSTLAHAHGGKTNAEGCHTEKKTGVYHCHTNKEKTAPVSTNLDNATPTQPLATDTKPNSGAVMKLDYEGFTVWLDCSKHGAVKFQYNAQHDTGNAARAADFYLDSNVPSECQQTSAKAYGKNYDRGHLVPANHLDSSETCLLYTSPSPRDGLLSRMPSSA